MEGKTFAHAALLQPYGSEPPSLPSAQLTYLSRAPACVAVESGVLDLLKCQKCIMLMLIDDPPASPVEDRGSLVRRSRYPDVLLSSRRKFDGYAVGML